MLDRKYNINYYYLHKRNGLQDVVNDVPVVLTNERPEYETWRRNRDPAGKFK